MTYLFIEMGYAYSAGGKESQVRLLPNRKGSLLPPLPSVGLKCTYC